MVPASQDSKATFIKRWFVKKRTLKRYVDLTLPSSDSEDQQNGGDSEGGAVDGADKHDSDEGVKNDSVAGPDTDEDVISHYSDG